MNQPCRRSNLPFAALRLAALPLLLATATIAAAESRVAPGELLIHTSDGPAGVCPLQHTAVVSDVSGFVARTTVRQTFVNPLDQKIEAIYVFPLPAGAAVDDLLMVVGDRRIVGTVKERDEARRIYEDARQAGHVASLLDQERPNVFTQSVANIEPGAEVVIEISYVETLEFEEGVFEWVFPMVVGPRYTPGTGRVPDADRVTPAITPNGTRAGHDIGITVNIEAGSEIFDLESVLHEVDVQLVGRSGTRVSLRDQRTIPNRDFVLRYRLATDEIGDAFLTHHDERGDFFTLILQPPQRVAPSGLVARELIFVVDSSGSMRGYPMEKTKQVMARMIDSMQDQDTFNLITFAGDTRILWEEPRPSTADNRTLARQFLDSRQGAGGTEMMQAIDAALIQPGRGDRERVRIVCFMTDGYVSNDMAIIDAVRRNADTTRVFSFGIGNSVNRYLLDGMAHAGRGGVEYVTLESRADAAVERFHRRVLSPVLTDIEIDWGGLPVTDVFPRRIPDLFGAGPVMVHGRLTGEAVGTVSLKGRTAVGDYDNTIEVRSAGVSAKRPALASLWARAKIADLMNRDLAALQRDEFPEDLEQAITTLGIEFRLMTRFTSFVAVEETFVTVGGESRRVDVPLEMPEGVSYDGVFGGAQPDKFSRMRPAHATVASRSLAMPKQRVERDSDDTRATKLASVLRGLSEKVEKLGRNGDLKVDGVEVLGYRIHVVILLSDRSATTLRTLLGLGFVLDAESSPDGLRGSLDVRKLDELARLAVVIRVTPV